MRPEAALVTIVLPDQMSTVDSGAKATSAAAPRAEDFTSISKLRVPLDQGATRPDAGLPTRRHPNALATICYGGDERKSTT